MNVPSFRTVTLNGLS